MSDLIDTLYTAYDFIIIDATPILGMTDSIHLSRFVDGVVLVAKAHKTPKPALIEAKKTLRTINANIMGVVLNGIREIDLKNGYYT